MLVALTVRMDEMADLRQQLFDQHGLIQAQTILGLLKRDTEWKKTFRKKLNVPLSSKGALTEKVWKPLDYI